MCSLRMFKNSCVVTVTTNLGGCLQRNNLRNLSSRVMRTTSICFSQRSMHLYPLSLGRSTSAWGQVWSPSERSWQWSALEKAFISYSGRFIWARWEVRVPIGTRRNAKFMSFLRRIDAWLFVNYKGFLHFFSAFHIINQSNNNLKIAFGTFIVQGFWIVLIS